jgi:hypothetical protein
MILCLLHKFYANGTPALAWYRTITIAAVVRLKWGFVVHCLIEKQI